MAANIEQHQVICKDGNITYLLTRKPVKNVNLRIKPDGSVLVSANDSVSIDFIDGFIKQKQKYIVSALAKYKEKRNLFQNVPKRYISGENYNLLGKSLRLKVEMSEQDEIYTDGVYIFLRVKDKDNFRHKEIILTKWLKEYQIAVFKELIDARYKVLRKYGVPYPKLRVRYMTSCWGSCQPKRGTITLNSRLIEAPRNCIEYVVLHEFVHFIQPNHSRQFWDFIAMMMPDWRERKDELEKRM